MPNDMFRSRLPDDSTSEYCSSELTLNDQNQEGPAEVALACDLEVGMPGVSTTLVSFDGVKFHVPSVLLTMASPLFSDMLRPKKNSSIPRVVPMSGVSATVLDTILRYLYPIPTKPSIKGVAEAASLVQIARRYQFAAVENNILADVTILLAAEPNPLRAWAGAIACGADVARKAAMVRFLQVEDEDFESVKKEAHPALIHATAQQLYDLEIWRAAGIKQGRQAIGAMKFEDCDYSTRRTLVTLVAGNIGSSINPFLHIDIFLPMLAQATGRGVILDPKARQIIIKAIRAEVQSVLTIFQGKPLVMPQSPTQAYTENDC